MDLSNILEISESWANVLKKQLNDSSLSLKDSPLTYLKDFNTEIGIFSLSFGIDASANATLFNSKDEADDLENYSSPFTAAGDGNAMLRYDLTTQLKESVPGAFKTINLNFEANQKVQLSSYKIHSNNDKLQKALLQDIASLKTIYSDKDILSLTDNEGVAVTYNGSLDAGVSISYSNLFSGTLSQLLKFLPKGTNLTGTANAGESLSFSVKIKDEFKLFIQKTSANQYQVNINKAKSNTTAVTARASISVNLDETEESFTTFMDNIFTALLGQPLDKVNNWVNTGLSNLSDSKKALLTEVTQRIKPLKDVDLTDDVIQTQFETFKLKVTDKAKEIIGKKLETAVSYEYQKSVKSNTVFRATLTENAVKENLKIILLMKVEELEDKEGVTIKEYIFSKTESITKKFGFQLAIGKFEAYWFNTQEYKFEIKDDYVENTSQISFSAQRSHSQGGRNEKEWHFKLSGQTNESAKIPVRMDNFAYSSKVYWEDQERKTKTEELDDFIEMGMIWDCIDSDFNETCKEIYKKIKDRRNVKFSCEVNIPAPTMTKLIPLLAQATSREVIRSLCFAMPHYSNKYRKGLDDLMIYYPLWKLYLDNNGKVSAEAVALQCYNQLKALYPKLANWEYKFKDGTNVLPGMQSYQSFVGLTENSNLAIGIKNLQKGLKALSDAISSKNTYSQKLIKKHVFKRMDDLVTSSGQNKTINITFLGQYLLDIARDNNLDENVSAKMTIEYKNDQNETTEMIFMKN